MEAAQLIHDILGSTNPFGIFSRTGYKAEYISMIKVIHPDVCKLPNVTEAVARLNALKDQIEALEKPEDDAGVMQSLNSNTISITGDDTVLVRSKKVYDSMFSQKGDAADHFKKYLPEKIGYSRGQLEISSNERMVLLSGLELPEHHVAWLLSRLFEFIGWMHQTGISHNGIVPESIAVVPETHGVVFLSFYHATEMGGKLETLSGKYLQWYAPAAFDTKKALPFIDISLAQRTALYLLGDKSGNGVKLKKTCNEDLINFLITPHYDAVQTYTDYRNLLTSIFGKPKFHHLNL